MDMGTATGTVRREQLALSKAHTAIVTTANAKKAMCIVGDMEREDTVSFKGPGLKKKA